MAVNKQKPIEFIDDSVEAVRKLPDVYIGALGNAGFKNMVREIVQNSLDEIIKGNTTNMNVMVTYDERTHAVIVDDNGQGIPTDLVELVFSKLHSSSNYDKVEGSGDYSSGKNGMGGTITNFLSEFFIVESYRQDGSTIRVRWEEGKVVETSKPKHIKRAGSGMMTTFAPSLMMGNITTTVDEIGDLLWKLCNLCKKGTTITYNSINKGGRKNSVIIKNTKGIYTFIETIAVKPIVKPIYFIQDNGTMKVECLLTFGALDTIISTEPIIADFANMCPTNGGTHVNGFMDAVIKFFKDYMNKIYLSGKKITVSNQDVKSGVRAVVSCFHLYPLFQGQAKDVFSEESMYEYTKNVTLSALDEWSSMNPTDLQKIAKYLKDICEIRLKSEGQKIKMADKYTSSVISGMPAKYKKPNNTTKGTFEVFFTEGDSAASGIENNRDKMSQGIYPLKGKIPNALAKSTKEFFSNEEVSGMFKVMGYDKYSKSFDPDKFLPKRVIILTDADPDGKHIEAELMLMFLVYLPFVILQGKLYCGTPPLYGINIGKNKMRFFADNLEYINYVQELFCSNNTIASVKNKVLSKNDIINVLYKNIDYVKEITRISNIYAIDPKFLEFILFNYNILKTDYNKFKRIIEKQYKFTNVSIENNTVMIRGLVNSKYHTIFCNDRLFNETIPILNMINRSENYFIINGIESSLYDLMILFNSFEPKSLTRYKGLGEMNPAHLGESTILPGYGRILKQYTIEDVKKTIDYTKVMNNDKSAFLKDVGTIRIEDII